jgi:hypothetical protein
MIPTKEEQFKYIDWEWEYNNLLNHYLAVLKQLEE